MGRWNNKRSFEPLARSGKGDSMKIGDLVRYTKIDGIIQYGCVGIVVEINTDSIEVFLEDGCEWTSGQEYWEVL